MRAVVTGAGGFVGRWLVAHLRESGDEVIALDRARLDITDAAAVANYVKAAQPEALYHLAALASPEAAQRDPLTAYKVTVLGTVHVLEAVRGHAPGCSVLVPGSAQVYGVGSLADAPLTEDYPIAPRHTYAATKAAQEAAVQAYAAAYGSRALITRSFNHIGPGQSTYFVVPSLAAQLLRGRVVHVGNLNVARDFTDVRDAVRAYRLLVLRGQPGVPYNVCSGRAVTIDEIVALLSRLVGVQAEIVVDPERVRPDDPQEFRGSHARLTSATGWEPKIELTQSLIDIVEALRVGSTC